MQVLLQPGSRRAPSQFLAPRTTDVNPTGHLVQVFGVAVLLLNEPIGHRPHERSPALEKAPAAQATHVRRAAVPPGW